MDPRIREGDEYGKGLTGTRASEAKGPFPGGKRVGSWGKKMSKSKSPWTAFHGSLVLHDERNRKRPTQRSGWA